MIPCINVRVRVLYKSISQKERELLVSELLLEDQLKPSVVASLLEV